MSTRIFMCLSTKLVGLHHVDESWLEFKTIVSDIDRRSSTDVGRSWTRELTEGLSAMTSKSCVKLGLIWLSSDAKAETFLSLALVLLINDSGST